MDEIDTNDNLNIEPNSTSLSETEENVTTPCTDLTEYKEVEEPCVALTIIGESRLSNVEVIVRRGFRYSIKAFFSTIVLTIMNLFI